jgi:hypothetical protein
MTEFPKRFVVGHKREKITWTSVAIYFQRGGWYVYTSLLVGARESYLLSKYYLEVRQG